MPDPGSTFRRLALDLPGTHESSHCGAADFRLNGRIFATLAYTARGLGTLKLTPELQQLFLNDLPELTEPAPGGWGRMGMTLIRLDAPEDILRGALSTAYRCIAEKQAAASSARKPPKTSSPKAPPRKRPRLK